MIDELETRNPKSATTVTRAVHVAPSGEPVASPEAAEVVETITGTTQRLGIVALRGRLPQHILDDEPR